MSDVADSAHVRIILSDYAVGDPNTGKLTIVGGGICVIPLDPAGVGGTLPFAVCAVITFDPVFIGESPALELALEKQDGELFALPTPAAGPLGPIQYVRVGTVQRLNATQAKGVIIPNDAVRPRHSFTMHFNNGLPLSPGQRYTWRVRVDHETRDELTEDMYVPAPDPGPVAG